MPYQYLDDVATADIAFEAWASTIEELFDSSADALMNVMVEDLNAIESKRTVDISLEEKNLEMLLYQFLEQFVYYKDAQKLLLRVEQVRIIEEGGRCRLAGKVYGEEIDFNKHTLVTDVKAVTFHRFNVSRFPEGWKATVILDV